MKYCIRRLIKPVSALLASAFLLVSCVSAPKKSALEGVDPQSAAAQSADSSVTQPVSSAPIAEVQAETEKPFVMDFYLSPPAEKKLSRVLDLPRLSFEKPSDITLMSPLSRPMPPVSKIPDPLPPPVVQAPKPSVPVITPALPVKPVPAPAKVTPKPPAVPTPKPVPAVTPPIAAPAARPLPASPPSAARVELPAAAPKAQIEVEAVRTQRFDLRFTGTGWTFLGDEQGSDGIRYETRRFEKNEAIFTLNPDRVGEYLLQFRRQDPVEQKTETLYVKVVVSALPSVAPAAGTTVQPAQQISPPAPSSTPTAVLPPAVTPSVTPAATPAVSPAATAGVPAIVSAGPAVGAFAGTLPVPAAGIAAAADYASISDPGLLLKFARDQLSGEKVQLALDALNHYVSLFSSGNDELYYLYALAYEQNTPFRNIKKSYENYKRVRDEYPRSKWRKDALERIAYLERHFYGLR